MVTLARLDTTSPTSSLVGGGNRSTKSVINANVIKLYTQNKKKKNTATLYSVQHESISFISEA